MLQVVIAMHNIKIGLIRRMSQEVREFSVTAFLWAVCSGVGRIMPMFKKNNSLTVSEGTKKTGVASGPSDYVAYPPVETPVFKIHLVYFPRGEARRIIGSTFKS